MEDAAERALVVKALTDGLGGCVEWDFRSEQNVRDNAELKGLTPEGIKRELIRLVRSGDAQVQQVLETRPRWRDEYRFYYKVVLPFPGFRHGLFVELRLVDDDDPEYPVVLLVNAHAQNR